MTMSQQRTQAEISGLEQSTNGSQTVGLVIRPFCTIAQDVSEQWNHSAVKISTPLNAL